MTMESGDARCSGGGAGGGEGGSNHSEAGSEPGDYDQPTPPVPGSMEVDNEDSCSQDHTNNNTSAPPSVSPRSSLAPGVMSTVIFGEAQTWVNTVYMRIELGTKPHPAKQSLLACVTDLTVQYQASWGQDFSLAPRRQQHTGGGGGAFYGETYQIPAISDRNEYRKKVACTL
ncbi:hypothetical protein B566_EDAN016847 [Ephemera danica]|nr:hypothetical protein B566_EDAN016847 [Ephemera danica]